MKKQAYNPYLPSYEYIPDGEPYVFENRVYVYGSHDRFGGYGYCQNDYVCWSAPVDDLGNWRCEGVIYPRNADPLNQDGDMYLYAPDVTVGPDGRYYLYYVLDHAPVVSVAVCDTPAGHYQFYGYVHYEDGTLLGKGPHDEPQFDPGVLTENGVTYLYTGFGLDVDPSRRGATVTILGPDMLTIVRAPAYIAPSRNYEKGTGYEGHAFFEASSIRKRNGKYYFIYSSALSHELCYAMSDSPLGPFDYQGTIISNCDLFIDSYKPADQPMYYGGNNHGSIVEIKGQWYVFYHRHTNGTNFSRQGCIEPIQFSPDGTIPQVEITSCGANGGPLAGYGEYPAYIACQLYCRTPAATVGAPWEWMDCRFPRITQDQPDGAEGTGYISNMRPGAVAGFKYFDCRSVKRISATVRMDGSGRLLVRTKWDGEVRGSIELKQCNEWKTYSGDIMLPDGIHALYFEFDGWCKMSLLSFKLESSCSAFG